MTEQQEKRLESILKERLKEQRLQGLREGAAGILGAVLEMCNKDKSIEDIKKFCETSLGLSGMK